ncbi:MAG: hypothetical protein PWP54_1407 [Thermosipho sp. (in: thermotogales)]|nr:hypothetical protein [Thermosipho sp. (in: thermotogales)]MDK2900136.1 hypothetical protein [Thermosipho sp. (in: thermotogales)]
MIYFIPIVASFLAFLIVRSSFTYAFSDRSLKNYSELVAVLVSGFIFVLISSLRWGTGFDWYPYFNYFYKSSGTSEVVFEFPEPLFCVFTYIISHLNLNYNVYLFIVNSSSLLVFLFYEKVLHKDSDRLIAFITIYGYIMPFYFGALRQSLAIAMSSIALNNLINGKKKIFWLFCIFAVLFHLSAIMLIFLYFLYAYINERKQTIILYVLAFFPVYLYLGIGLLSLFKNFVVVSRLLSYQGLRAVSEDLNYALRNSLLLVERIALAILFFAIYRIIKKTNQQDEDSLKAKYFINTYIFGTIFYISAMFTFRNLAGRGIIYFRIADIFFFSILPKYFPSLVYNKDSYLYILRYQPTFLITYMIVLAYLIARFAIITIIANAVFYFPYRSIFY